MPEVGAARQAVVVLRMCGCTQIGSPVLGVLERYAQQMQAGVSDQVMAQLRKTETTDTIAGGTSSWKRQPWAKRHKRRPQPQNVGSDGSNVKIP